MDRGNSIASAPGDCCQAETPAPGHPEQPRFCSLRSQPLSTDPPRPDPGEAVCLQLLCPCPVPDGPHRSAAGDEPEGSRAPASEEQSRPRKGDRAPPGPRALPGLPTSPHGAGHGRGPVAGDPEGRCPPPTLIVLSIS